MPAVHQREENLIGYLLSFFKLHIHEVFIRYIKNGLIYERKYQFEAEHVVSYKYDMADIQVLNSIYQSAVELGIVDNQYAFSKLCGRKPNWFSCSKSIGRNISISAMVTFAVKLDHLSLSHLTPSKRVKARLLAKTIWEQIEAETLGLDACAMKSTDIE